VNRTSFLVLYLVSILIFVIAGIASELSLFNLTIIDIAASIMFFDYFFIELCLVLIVSVWLINADNKLLRFSGYALTTCFIAINLFQMIAIKRGGEFLSRLAIENSNHISIIATKANLLSLAGLIFLCLLLPFIIEKKFPQVSKRKNLFSITSILVVLVLLTSQSEQFLPKGIFDYRTVFFYNNNIQHTSPSLAMYNVLFEETMLNVSNDFTPEEIKELRKYGFYFNAKSQYPLIKERIYTGVEPFASQVKSSTQPNVIVFFAEGFSARAMNAYQSKFKDLTPNLDKFAQHTMVVDNYYNHTAATYRGLHGQLCSLYPFYGGNGGWKTNYKDMPERSYLCLNHIFENNNYETFFFDSHRKDNAFVDELARDLGFQYVLTAEELSPEYLNGVEPGRGFALTDPQFYESFVNFLKSRETSNKPFFASLYNLETHAFVDIASQDNAYGDGKNNALNTIHNFDYAFGQFWQYFKNSPYSENTIVIFTSDHAHYTEKSFTQAFAAEDYQRLFIDKIPMLIYDPSRRLPARYNARNSTSIDFAPSLIHYLGFENIKNPFLGTSIFTKDRKAYDGYGIASFGNDFYFIDDKIYSITIPSVNTERLELISKFIKVSQQKETHNELWNDNAASN